MTVRYRIDRLFDGRQMLADRVLTVGGGKVVAVDQQCQHADVHLPGIVAPGLMDLQVNGGGGVLLNDCPDSAAMARLFQAHTALGTTSMLPTVITDSLAVMTAAADAVAEARRHNPHGIIGIHFEGPHIAAAKKGAHCGDQIRPLSEAEWQLYLRDDLGVKLVTLAPETVSCAEIQTLTAMGVRVFLGHSNASADQAQQALKAGAVGFTHLFNAMSAFGSREPGMVGAALLDDSSVAGLIADGQHLDYRSARVALRCKGADNIALVTDAMPLVGSDQQRFTLVDREVHRQGDRLLAHSGELAGSLLDMGAAVRNAVLHLGVSLEQALRMASAVPARALGLEALYGHLRPGAVANLVWLSPQLRVQGTWVAGRRQTVETSAH
ncbi:N-acetylglucosamine 6-phosphate deacetylase [Ferrimonas sediminum]|uniref:N-acetylgalactosamine-6-phosphate deacetylase n=1 Tax=Ferrimonas sediminum TaxID=718193 RepID=A0A1G8XLV2_9GAMM|nr:N-acetylglucosamine-6-phosphate deacetylase [Ferrimonas sediminum]SDJ91144.1 N-acetylglucosamine 6-phosphate deacetylase [Ferrimonas sediminum]